MIITLSGITGTGKSFFKNVIVKELGLKNLIIVTTRAKRKNETNGIDKEFVTNEQFEELKTKNEIVVDFEFLGSKYAYKNKDLNSQENQVTEVHYSTICEFKKNAKDVFSIYMIPSDFERAKLELKKRELPKDIEEKRIQEMKEHIEKFSKDKDLQNQFDYIFVNDYTESSQKQLIEVVKKQIRECINV